MCFRFAVCLLCCTLQVIATSVHIKKVRSEDTCKSKPNTTNVLQDLKKCLFNGYNPKAVPLQEQDKFVYVDMAFSLEDVYIMDVSSEISFFVIMDMNWTDPFLKWNPQDYGNISKIILTQGEAAKVWTPMFTSAYTYRFGSRKDSDDLFNVAKLEVHPNGNVVFSDLIFLNSLCYGDLRDFPFDRYECDSIIMSDNFENEVVFRFWKKGAYVNTTELNLSLYTKKLLHIDTNVIFVDATQDVYQQGEDVNMTITMIYFNIYISRETGTHIIVFHIPAIGFCLLSLLPLWISADSVTRFLYPVIVIFGSLFQMDAISSLMRLPANFYSQPIFLVAFYNHLMIISLVALVESMISAVFWTRKPLPQWLTSMYDQISSSSIIEHLVEFTLFEKPLPEAVQGQKEDAFPDPKVTTFKSLAKFIDRIFFCALVLTEVYLYWDLVPAEKPSNPFGFVVQG